MTGEEGVEVEGSRSRLTCFSHSLSQTVFCPCPCKGSSEIRGLTLFPGRTRQTLLFTKPSGTHPEPVRVWAPTPAQLSLHNSPPRGNGIIRNRGEPSARPYQRCTNAATTQHGCEAEGTIRQREVLGNEKDGSQNKHLLTPELKNDKFVRQIKPPDCTEQT